MRDALPWLIAVAALATLAVLALGIGSMFRRHHDPARANVLMRWRVGLQALTVALVVLFLILMGA